MAKDVIIAVQRGATHTPVAGQQAVPVRIVEKTIFVASSGGGADSYFLIELFSLMGIPDIQQFDRLVDTVSGQQYRVSGVPITHDSSFLSVELTRFSEVTP